MERICLQKEVAATNLKNRKKCLETLKDVLHKDVAANECLETLKDGFA